MHWETGRLSEVTVLFADCRGYTRLTQELGIEKLAPITEEFFKASAAVIRQNHGIVDRLLGDAVMAFFNVPIKHDDHVLRAVEAAFRIQEAVRHINVTLEGGVVLGVGIGIATGAALATNMGSTSCSDYTMVGDTINIAARLQGQAAPGEVLVTEDAYKSISAAFPGAMRAEYLLKGIARPVAAHRLVRDRTS
ncbi:MAG TPA: adenylate/guanylate cyclase domain-containing protein [Candidatus Binatia bacterium]